MDFPASTQMKPTLSVLSAQALGIGLQALGGTAPSSGTWTSTSRAIFVPFALAAPFQVRKVWWANGATLGANADCGVYSIGGTLLGSTGSTAQAGTSVVQSVSLSLLLQPGSYYVALVLSNTTGTVLRTTALTTTLGQPTLGIAQQATAFPLPATATLAVAGSAFLPLFGITSASVI